MIAVMRVPLSGMRRRIASTSSIPLRSHSMLDRRLRDR
jgi:hypothetical protein